MTLMVEITSEETIKPSSPTPQHLRTLKFSLLDQYTPSVAVPIILFFSANSNKKLTPKHLKTSLSDILVQFYPLAGRISGNDFISCNEEGVTFFEARVNTDLSLIVTHPMQPELYQLLPRGIANQEVLLSIQVNIFDCGGIALAVGMSHKVGDASSLVQFLNNWASLARGKNKNEIPRPKFAHTSLFRPIEGTPPMTGPLPTEKVISKRFVFDASSITALRAKCSNKSCVEHPTKVEAVSALVWKSMSTAIVMVNLRKRFAPPLSDLYIGNLTVATGAAAGAESQHKLHVLAGLLHTSIAKIGEDYVKKLQADGGVSLHLKSLYDTMQQSGGIGPLWISSWCRFPFYDTDFGSGKPVWICPAIYLASTLMLMDTNCGTGVEAWVALNEEDMSRLESCLELRDVLVHDHRDL